MKVREASYTNQNTKRIKTGMKGKQGKKDRREGEKEGRKERKENEGKN
jgi:hypothetical protein